MSVNSLMLGTLDISNNSQSSLNVSVGVNLKVFVKDESRDRAKFLKVYWVLTAWYGIFLHPSCLLDTTSTDIFL